MRICCNEVSKILLSKIRRHGSPKPKIIEHSKTIANVQKHPPKKINLDRAYVTWFERGKWNGYENGLFIGFQALINFFRVVRDEWRSSLINVCHLRFLATLRRSNSKTPNKKKNDMNLHPAWLLWKRMASNTSAILSDEYQATTANDPGFLSATVPGASWLAFLAVGWTN